MPSSRNERIRHWAQEVIQLAASRSLGTVSGWSVQRLAADVDQKLFAKMIEARVRMKHWATRAKALMDAGKTLQARRAFATAERWEAKAKAYEKRWDRHRNQ